ncbi:MAG: hypothetical protein ACUVRP_12400 [Chlorobiales bacterium]
MTAPLPTVFECFLEKSLYLAALSNTSTILKHLSEPRAMRVNTFIVNFLSKYEIFTPLLARLTKNYWITLTDDEKSHRATIRQQTLAFERERALLDGISVRKKIAKKFFKAHKLNKPIRLSNVESAWLDSNPDCRVIVSVKSNFIVPISHDEFDFSEEAFDRLAMRLRFEMLTPNDLILLKAHGVPILPDNTISLDDTAWAREPYTKAVLYRLVKYRKDEQAMQANRIKDATMLTEKSFKRVQLLIEDETSPEPIATQSNQLLITNFVAQIEATPTPITSDLIAQPLKRVELESNDVPCKSMNSNEVSQRRWIEDIKKKLYSLFGISTKVHVFAG